MTSLEKLVANLRDPNFVGQEGMRLQAADAIEDLQDERDRLLKMRDGLLDILRQINPFAPAAKQRGGRAGGLARAASMSDEERSEIATKAANARWGNDR